MKRVLLKLCRIEEGGNIKMKQPSSQMITELKRLRNIVLSCDQQFGDFIRYCMTECEIPEDHVLDLSAWVFIPKPQPSKVASIGEGKKKEG